MMKDKPDIPDFFRQRMADFFHWGNQILLGKEEKLKLTLSGCLAGGHILLEDVPGVGKTTLVQFLSKVFGLSFKRIQFTNDLLPADILGGHIFDQANQKFVFHPGPIFGQMIMIDEINRATPKTQSALLEVMEEMQVTIDGSVYAMDRPFIVVATQNPLEHVGTSPLPESQLDRFLLCLDLGYPSREFERRILQNGSPRVRLESVPVVLQAAELLEMRKFVQTVFLSDSVANYILNILETSRGQIPGRHLGLSTRAGLALVQVAKAYALIEGRSHVLPEDVQAVAEYVLGHRLVAGKGSGNVMPLREGREICRQWLLRLDAEALP